MFHMKVEYHFGFIEKSTLLYEFIFEKIGLMAMDPRNENNKRIMIKLQRLQDINLHVVDS